MCILASCQSGTEPPDVSAVSVSPPTSTLTAIGATVQLTAVATASDGAQVTGAVTWASGNTAVITVTAAGLVTAVADGTTTVTASVEGVEGSTTITVAQQAQTVTVTPSSDTLTAIGATAQLTAEAADANGNAITGAAMTWASSNAGVATVDANGLVTANGVGVATISATSGDAVGSAAITVSQAAGSVSVSPSEQTLTAVDATVQLTATVTDANGNAIAGAAVTWSSSSTGAATVSGSGLVTAVANGSSTITATSGSASGTSVITVAQTASSVTVTPATDTLAAPGATTQLAASVEDANGHAVAGASVSWSSSDTAVASVDGSGLVTAKATGTTTITATSGTASGTATIVVASPVGTATWTKDIGSSITGGIALGSDGTLFVGNGGGGELLALDPADGATKWTWTSATGFVGATPTVDLSNNRVIVAATSQLVSLDANSGTQLWSLTIPGSEVWGRSVALGSGGEVYAVNAMTAAADTDDRLYRIDGASGTESWNATRKGLYRFSENEVPAIDSNGRIYVAHGDTVTMFNTDGSKFAHWFGPGAAESPAFRSNNDMIVSNNVQLHRVASGAPGPTWFKQLSSGVCTPPVIDADRIYVITADNMLQARNVSDGNSAWSVPVSGHCGSTTTRTSPLLGDDATVYVAHGSGLTAFDATTGAQKWSYAAGSSAVSSPTMGSDGTVFFITSDGTVHAVITDSSGLSSGHWPKYQQDAQNHGRR